MYLQFASLSTDADQDSALIGPLDSIYEAENGSVLIVIPEGQEDAGSDEPENPNYIHKNHFGYWAVGDERYGSYIVKSAARVERDAEYLAAQSVRFYDRVAVPDGGLIVRYQVNDGEIDGAVERGYGESQSFKALETPARWVDEAGQPVTDKALTTELDEFWANDALPG